MRSEQRELELRKRGQLAELLGEALAGEPSAALRLLASEDQRQAEEGLVALTSNGKVYYTKDYAREPNNVRFKDANTGKEMTIPTADVRSISSEEYDARPR